ncbi:MAG: DNA repair protein RadA [Acidimicrobiia bacterium]|nr:DNA repair protein RadA [Acidimicrobiia bacterium]
MSRTSVRGKTVYGCTECGAQAPRWLGRCQECGAWSSLVEERVASSGPARRSSGGTGAPEAVVALMDVDPILAKGRPSGVAELDRVLGGGLVAGSVTLLGGEPGIGKSTLLLQSLGRMAAAGAKCLLVSAEESKEQVRLRAERLDALHPNVLVVAETSLPAVLDRIAEVAPDVLAVDSIQTLLDPELNGIPGSVGQVRECAHRLVRAAKERAMATVLVGHVTKDGSLAGPRALEHIVDTVLAFEGDRHHSLRMLHALKHRFGTTNELGVFEMTEAGMNEVGDPSSLFLADRRCGLPGSVVTATMEGVRPLLVEVQALLASTPAPAPRRSARGLDGGRLDLILAVLHARIGRPVNSYDVYASVAGGLKVHDAGADLAVALAVASALNGEALPDGIVAIGEVGLGGELRQPAQTARRLHEAARMGFHTAIVPASTPEIDGIRLLRAEALADVMERFDLA